MMKTSTVLISLFCLVFASVLIEYKVFSLAAVFIGMFFLLLTDAIVSAIVEK